MRYEFFSALLIFSFANKTKNDKIQNIKPNKLDQIVLIFEKKDVQINSEKKLRY